MYNKILSSKTSNLLRTAAAVAQQATEPWAPGTCVPFSSILSTLDRFQMHNFYRKKKKSDSDAFRCSHLHGSGRTIKKWKKTPLPVHSPLLLFPFPFNLPVSCKTSYFFFLQMLSGVLLCWDTWATKNISRGTTFPTSKTVLLPSQGRENRAIWW